jgi:hypothetical protein
LSITRFFLPLKRIPNLLDLNSQDLRCLKKDPKSATLLTGAIVYLANLAQAKGLPLDPALCTIAVLYISRLSLDIFCGFIQQPKE